METIDAKTCLDQTGTFKSIIFPTQVAVIWSILYVCYISILAFLEKEELKEIYMVCKNNR